MYKDKTINQEEYDEIINYESLNKARQYALNLLSKGYYTEKEVRSRLVEKKKLSYKNADAIINYLIEHNFINDKRYLEEFVESLHNKNYGKNKILQKCYDEGFKKDLIEELSFSYQDEVEKAKEQITRFVKNKNASYQKIKETGYAFLLNQGFDFEICSIAIKIVDEVYDFSLEKELLRKEAENILNKFSEVLNKIPDSEETRYIVDNLNRTREDVMEQKNPEKILRNAHLDKQGSVVTEKGKWTK